MEIKIIGIRENPHYLEQGIEYFASKWNVGRKVYEESITDSITTSSSLPRWYLMLKSDEIIGSYGLIQNDFIDRIDLFPWLCALYVEKNERGKQLGAKLLEHGRIEAAKLGYKKIYLCTDHDRYYEKYNWRYIGNGVHPGGTKSRIYENETIDLMMK